MRIAKLLLVPVVAVGMLACGEKVQTIPVGTAKKLDAQVWQTKDARYLAPGWTPGDEASWNAQMANRAQAQNDYAPRK
ncbi:MAG: hypothetical protein ABIQ33_03120 [Caldimonas sp.]